MPGRRDAGDEQTAPGPTRASVAARPSAASVSVAGVSVFTPDAPPLVRHVRTWVAAVVTITMISVAGVLYIGFQAADTVIDANRAWLAYQQDAAAVDRSLDALQASIGYGGFIHSLKNYVLRRQPEDLQAMQRQITDALGHIAAIRAATQAAIRAVPLSGPEQRALHAVARVFRIYADAMEQAVRLPETLGPAAIDRVVQVDDRPALEGLRLLLAQTAARRDARQSTARLAGDEARAFLRANLAVAILLIAVAALVLVLLRRVASTHAVAERVAGQAGLLFDGAPDAMVHVDGTGRILRANDQAVRLFGHAREVLVGLGIDDLVPAPLRDRHALLRTGYSVKPTDRRMGQGRALQAVTRDGTSIDVDISLSHARWPEGDLVTATIRDISSDRDLQRRLQAAEAEADTARREAGRSDRAKSAFLSSMSHELRTPLNAIVGFSDLLKEAGDSITAPVRRDFIDHIVQSGEHLASLIDDLLDLSALETGRIPITIEDVPVGPLIDQCLTMARIMAAPYGVSIVHHGADHRHRRIRADATRVRQVLLNLLSNSVKYNRAGGSVHLDCSDHGGLLRIAVNDTGHGFSPEQIDALFEPFNRLGKEGGSTPGTGIGLTISHRLVIAMGGDMGCVGTPEVGSTFWFDLPLAAAAPATVPADEPATAAAVGQAETAGAAAPDAADQKAPVVTTVAPIRGDADDGGTGDRFSHHKVLYIEDNPANIALMRAILSDMAAIELVTAPSAEWGVALATSMRPDLVLMDLDLPGMDGFDALQQLRAHGATADIPAIAVTAQAHPVDIRRGRAAGFQSYLIKPVKAGDIRSSIEQALAA